METYVVKRLAQARLLSDPFKLKLLEEFAENPSTTKQVADRMGEKAPKLYRHVDALFEEGLLKLVEEKPKRGTIERYYATIAARFEVDPELFSPAGEGGDEAANMLRGIFRDTESDLLRYFEKHRDDMPEHEDLPLVMKVAIRGTSVEMAALKQKLEAWLEECEALASENAADGDGVSYRGLLAFYPTDSGEQSASGDQSD